MKYLIIKYVKVKFVFYNSVCYNADKLTSQSVKVKQAILELPLENTLIYIRVKFVFKTVFATMQTSDITASKSQMNYTRFTMRNTLCKVKFICYDSVWCNVDKQHQSLKIKWTIDLHEIGGGFQRSSFMTTFAKMQTSDITVSKSKADYTRFSIGSTL